MVSSDEINRRLEARRRGVKYQEPRRRTIRDTPADSGANSKECPECHTQNPPTAKFCVGCGEKLETPPEEEGFTPEIKGPESEPVESKNVEKPIKSAVTQRPDDFGRPGRQKIQPMTGSEKLEPIVPKTPEPEIKPTEPETTIKPEPTPKPPEPPQVKRPESIPTPESPVKESTTTPAEKPKPDIDPVERIKKAKGLLDIGAINQEEFDAIQNKYLELDSDPVEKIKKAKSLLDTGVITQEEFDSIKNKYLDEI